MAQYVRFEIYLPVAFTKKTRDSVTEVESSIVQMLDSRLLAAFITEARGNYIGITQANPLATAAFKGWWQPNPDKPADVDYLTFLFGLVRIDQADDAQKFFDGWKSKFEKELQQQMVLVLFYPIQTIGEFFRRSPGD